MDNIDFSQQVEQTEIDSEQELIPYIDEYLKGFDIPQKAEKNAEILKNNKNLLNAMRTFVDNKIQKLLENGIDENEQKNLIAAYNLKNGYNLSFMPKTDAEKKQRSYEIEKHYRKLDGFKDIGSKYKIDTDLDKITTFTTGNDKLNIFLKDNELMDNFIYKMKNHQLNLIGDKLGPRSFDYPNPEHESLDAKREELWQEERLFNNKGTYEMIDNPTKCLELAREIADLGEVETYEQFTVKRFLISLINKGIDKQDQIFRYPDLRWDHETNSLETDNIQLIEKGNDVTLKNTLTGQTSIVNEKLFVKGKDNKEQSIKDGKLFDTTEILIAGRVLGKKTQEKLKGKNQKEQSVILKEKTKDYSNEEKHNFREKVQIETLLYSFTENKDMFVAIRRKHIRYNRREALYGKQRELINKVIKTINPKIDFDCINGRTSMELKKDNGEMIFQIKQGRSIVKLGFNKVSANIVKMNEKEIKADEEKVQTNIENDGFTLEQAKEENPDIYRALKLIKNPSSLDLGDYSDKKSIQNINLQGLSLTTKQINILIPELNNVEGKFRLDLGNNQLENVPKNIFAVKNLTNIDLSSNNLQGLPKLNGLNIDHIAELDLGQNSFNYLPNINQLKNLTHINLSGNEISDIKELGKLKKLKVTSLYENNISDISSLIDIESLKILGVGNNNISKLPTTFRHEGLKKLDLGGNKLENNKKLDKEDKNDNIDLSSFPRIQSLNIENNNFSKRPLSGSSSELLVLDISGNEFDTNQFPEQIKKLYPQIKNIDFYEQLLTGYEAKDRFLDGYFSNSGFDITNDKANKLSLFFDETKNIAYGMGYSESKENSKEMAKKTLQKLHLDDNKVHYMTKQTKNGYETYAFTSADELNNVYI